MKSMKNVKTIWLALVLLVVANFHVDIGYSLQVSGYDSTTRDCKTYVKLSAGQTLVLQNGESKTIEGNVSGRIIRRAEMGWHEMPIKAKRHIRISLRKVNALKPELLASCAFSVRRNRRFPNVDALFSDKVPSNFLNDVDGWNFSKNHFLENKGELLTMDVDFGESCSLNCPHCFRRNGSVNASGKPTLSYAETIDIIHQAKDLGLESVKILGAGEPFENKQFLSFLRDMKDLNVQVNVFTKAHVFGDDDLAQKYFSLSSLELAREIKRLGTSLNVGCNSFDPVIQDKMVGTSGYTIKRNRALETLTQVGLNDCQPTKLCLAMVPITHQNVDEIFDMYKWARERNIYPIATPSMCAGRATNFWQDICPSLERLIALYSQINIYNVEKGITTIDELKENGISAYAGGCPCHQVACGMYITSRGIVLRCPGDDVTIFGDVRKESIADIWHNSENYIRRQGVYNCHCPPKDGRSIPCHLYSKVFDNVLRHFQA